MTIKPKWDSKSAGEYERRLKAEREDDDDIQDYKKPWVGLTDEEIEDCYKQGGIGRAIQMLKEKNT